MELRLVRLKGKQGLLPYTKSDIHKYESIKYGKPMKAKLTNPRNIKLHNKLISLLRLFVNQTSDERFHPTNESWQEIDYRINLALDALKVELGITTEYMSFDGEVRLKPSSISFEAMDEDDFQVKVWLPARKIIATLIGVTEDDIDNNLVFYS